MKQIEAIKICKTFKTPTKVEVLSNINISAELGESVAIIGPSGVGKSTLLHILGTLEEATCGTLKIGGELAVQNSLCSLRQNQIGFVFQSYHLFDEMSVLENILLPAKIARRSISKGSDAYRRAIQLIQRVGLSDRETFPTKLLSGGEKQRTCIARALINDSRLIIADEPTGNLDKVHSDSIQKLLLEVCNEDDRTLIVATHDIDFANQCDQLVKLHHS